MSRTTRYAQTSALPAIAAALALISTPSLAQSTTPSTTDPAATAQPAPTPPVTDATPVPAEPTATVSTTTPSASPDPATTATAETRTVRTTRTPAPKSASTVTRTAVTRHAAAPARTATAQAASAPAPAPTAIALSPEPVAATVAGRTSKPAPAPAATGKPASGPDETLPIAGGALALLALGGAAYGLSRRRRHEEEWVDEEWADETAMTHAPEVGAVAAAEPRHDPIVHDEQPQIVAPSAFAWGATAPQEDRQRDAGDDRLPGETWVQRAYRGPTANNPSVSLKNRLRRAAFFDKRERDVAAGLAEPVEPDAGLPEAMTEEREREFA